MEKELVSKCGRCGIPHDYPMIKVPLGGFVPLISMVPLILVEDTHCTPLCAYLVVESISSRLQRAI